MAQDSNRIARARASLLGLAVADAFGEQFFSEPSRPVDPGPRRELPEPPWRWTDDTAMAWVLVDHLAEHGGVDQDVLARCFAAAYADDPHRGYGPGMHHLLPRIAAGADWRTLAAEQFGGQGSWGNGSAMRVAPLGAFFADDLDRAAEEAARQAAVTHAHAEAIAGAVAVAVAAGAVAGRDAADADGAVLGAVLDRVEHSEVRLGIEHIAALPADTPAPDVVAAVGNGAQMSCPDTVPFSLWVAVHHLDDFETAVWTTATAGGDRDTTSAIVGGILAGGLGEQGIPATWIESCEDLPRFA